jgi:hypothetical protein
LAEAEAEVLTTVLEVEPVDTEQVLQVLAQRQLQNYLAAAVL